MYFYDENKTLYENFKALLSDYNRVCAIVNNNKITGDSDTTRLEQESTEHYLNTVELDQRVKKLEGEQ